MLRWLACGLLLLAQAATEQKPAFDVASIKPNAGGPQSGMTRFAGGRYITRYTTIEELITYAYAVNGRSLIERQVLGGPSWLATDRFDIEATAPGIVDDARGMIPAEVQLRIRSLLEERCALATHYEQRELSQYALVVATRDGSLGPKLRRRTTPCVPATAVTGTIPIPRSERCGGRAQPGLLMGMGGSMDQLAYGIARFIPDVGRVVVNRTGLIGFFDFELTWTPESTSLFTALEEQLGLKLEPIRGPVDVLVIDHVEKPTPN